jgi:DNA-binding NarL/FixJ family response regulator
MAELTRREAQVCELIGRGLTVKAAARHMGISPKTVEHRIKNAGAKLPGDGPPRHRITVHVIQRGLK